MAASSSSSLLQTTTMAAPSIPDDGEVVDLGVAANLDDATTKLFFSDGDSVSADLSWPAAAEFTSALTSQNMLRGLCDRHGVPREFTPLCAGYSASACGPPPPGSKPNAISMCVYAAALDAGLRFPLHEFYARVLRTYGLAPSQLTPNAWRCLAAFVLLCEDAGVEPLVAAFRYFFTVCAHKRGGMPAGWHHFQPYTSGGRRLFTGNPPTRPGWKGNFFFLEAPAAMPWKCPVRWGKPRREAARKVEHTEEAIDRLKAMGRVDIMSFLAGREMPVGDQIRLQAAVKAEARDRAAAAAAACTRGNKRKSPPPPAAALLSCPQQPLPTTSSAPPPRQLRTPPTPVAVSMAPPIPTTALRTPAYRRAGSSITSSSGSAPPPPHNIYTMCASDALQLWEAVSRVSEQAAIIGKLEEELRTVRDAWSAQCKDQQGKHAAERGELMGLLGAATLHSKRLEVEVAQLRAENAQLKQEVELLEKGVRDTRHLDLAALSGYAGELLPEPDYNNMLGLGSSEEDQ